MSTSLILLVAALVIAAFALSAFRQTSSLVDAYRAKRPLSEPEQILYWRLREAMPDCVVLCQVAFSRFLEPSSRQERTRRRLFFRIAQKSVDYLVCLPDFTIIAAIELDDGTHRPDKDSRRDAIFASASIPLIRLQVRSLPQVNELRAMFTK